ncbi:lipoprotein N-acyltransferase Lnb domain-containing protein [Veronia nyctiphanis]|uniref:lipoprotein N-acyltransferase Lnb domain-containing protein n=1 Tax=Veronia nyctiphanis TaxID=1278244 RepID=UPI00137577CA|nr:DUF4105 domain-containing protein [Veronia nyctiphanis]
MKRALKLVVEDFSPSDCDERFSKYIDHVPFDRLELVFASEVFSSSSSMMGHIFLKTSGKNYRNVPVSHSLAYFTEITTLNPITLIAESLVTGMPGFFTVRPFEKDRHQYVDIEERNLWQFTLSAEAESIELIRLHLWELKDTDLVYYFQSFNCATLTLELLALIKPDVLDERRLFVSPLDVVKAARDTGLINTTNVIAADKWLRYVLDDQLSSTEKQQVDDAIADRGIVASLSPLQKQYFSLIDERAEVVLQGNFVFDLSKYKHPAKTPQDSVFSVGLSSSDGQVALISRFLAAGHSLSSDNRQYLHESELVMGNIVVETSFEDAETKLREFALYSVRTLPPSTQIDPSWSGELYLGYRPSFDSSLSSRSQGELSFGFGKTLSFHKDLRIFSLVGGGLGSDFNDTNLFGSIKVGVIADLILDSKFVSELEWASHKLADSPGYISSQSSISWFPAQDNAVAIHYSVTKNELMSKNEIGLTYSLHF